MKSIKDRMKEYWCDCNEGNFEMKYEEVEKVLNYIGKLEENNRRLEQRVEKLEKQKQGYYASLRY